MPKRGYRRAIIRLIQDDSGVPGFLFIRGKSRKATQLLMEHLKRRGSFTRNDMGQFARDLQQGFIEEGFTYDYSSFYTRVLNRLLDCGLLEFNNRHYRPVWQPVSKRGPGGHNFYNLCFRICEEWNTYFFET